MLSHINCCNLKESTVLDGHLFISPPGYNIRDTNRKSISDSARERAFSIVMTILPCIVKLHSFIKESNLKSLTGLSAVL